MKYLIRLDTNHVRDDGGLVANRSAAGGELGGDTTVALAVVVVIVVDVVVVVAVNADVNVAVALDDDDACVGVVVVTVDVDVDGVVGVDDSDDLRYKVKID